MPIEHEAVATLDDFDYEKYIIGSSFNGSEGMFELSKDDADKNDDLNETDNKAEQGLSREQFKIYADVEPRYDATLYKMGYKTADLDGIKYPKLNEWANYRLRNNRWIKFYPSFVEDQEGNVRFAKTQIRKEKCDINSLWNEAVILSSDLPAKNHVKLINFCHSDTQRLTSIVTDAIPPSEGRTADGKEWLPVHAENAARRIKELENYDLEEMQEGIKVMPQFSRRIKAADRLSEMAWVGTEFIDNETVKLMSDSVDYENNPRPTFVHGDLCAKNVILKRDGTATFVDWETASTGFLGQDAGKLLSELSVNKRATDAFLGEYLGSGPDFDNERYEALKLSVVTENLVHINYRIGTIDKNKFDEDIVRVVESIAPYEARINDSLRELATYRSHHTLPS
jgi:hypothetical protein